MLRPHLILAFLCGLALTALAEARTLTAADGRTIDAEVVGFDGLDKVKVKRADTGQTFTLPISSFADADRDALLAEAKAEASKPPPPPRDGEIVVELSRNSGSSVDSSSPVMGYTGYDNILREIGSVKVIDTDTAYTITLVNRTTRPFENLRVDYVLFLETGSKKMQASQLTKTRTSGSAPIKLLPANKRESVKTTFVRTRKTTIKGRATWNDVTTGSAPIDLSGIWLRVYIGDTLVLESATPPSLAKENSWNASDTAEAPVSGYKPVR